jgi:uncharacterized glyoxalase superfamily protein PhnB
MTHTGKPPGYNSVSPYLVTKNAQEVIDFLCATLDAIPLRRHENEDGSTLHAEVRDPGGRLGPQNRGDDATWAVDSGHQD